MTNTNRYCYLGGDEIHSGMYVALIRRLENEGLCVDLVARIKVSLNPVATLSAWRGRDRLGTNPIAAVQEQIRGRIHMIPMWSPLPGLSAAFLSRAVGGCAHDRRVVLHTRQIAMGRLALSLKRWCGSVRVIPELEGDGIAEARYKHEQIVNPTWLQEWRRRLEEWFYFHHEGRLIRGSDAVICVSNKLKEVMIGRYGLTAEQAARIHIFPCFASRDRFAFSAERRASRRRALGVEGRFVVAYNGSLFGRWQVPEKIVEAFQLIQETRPDALLLVVTPEEHFRYIRPHIEAAQLSADSVRLHSAPHGEVTEYLCAADVGLLLRDRHPMNEAAAPGKFAEYVLSGLPIIMTEGIGDYSEVARQSECACVLPDIRDLAASKQVLQRFCATGFTDAQRNAFSRWSAERFAIELYIPRLAALYRSLAEEGPESA